MSSAPEFADLSLLSGLAPELASTFVRVASDIALVIGDDGVIRSMAEGRAGVRASGEDWVGRPWADTVTRDTRRKIEMLLQEAQTHGVSRRREVSHPGSGGSDIPVSWAAVRLGQAGPVLAVGRDLRTVAAIQQRFVEAQQELERDYWQRRQAETRYRMLFQVASEAVLVVDADTLAVIEANPTAHTLLGHPAQGLERRKLGDCVDPPSRAPLDELMSSARASGRSSEQKLRLDAQGPPHRVSATPFRAGERLCLLVRAHAVEPGATFFEYTPDAAVITDSSGRIRMANPAFARLCRVPDEARLRGWMIGDALGDLQHHWPALLAQVRSNGLVGRAPVRLHMPGSAALRAEVSGALLADGEQEDVGFTVRLLGEDEPAPGHEPLASALGALATRLGQLTLPELLQQATLLAERHLIEDAWSRAGGQLHSAAALLLITPEQLTLRLNQHGLSPRAFLN
jgi:transcriptional regulator PpsR